MKHQNIFYEAPDYLTNAETRLATSMQHLGKYGAIPLEAEDRARSLL